MEPLGPCRICGEMVYEDDGEDMSTSGDQPVYEHFACEDE